MISQIICVILLVFCKRRLSHAISIVNHKYHLNQYFIRFLRHFLGNNWWTKLRFIRHIYRSNGQRYWNTRRFAATWRMELGGRTWKNSAWTWRGTCESGENVRENGWTFRSIGRGSFWCDFGGGCRTNDVTTNLLNGECFTHGLHALILNKCFLYSSYNHVLIYNNFIRSQQHTNMNGF